MDDTLTILDDSLARLWKGTVDPKSTIAAERVGLDERAWRALIGMGVVGTEPPLSMPELAVVMKSVSGAGALVPYADSEGIGRWLANAASSEAAKEILTAAVVDPGSVRACRGTDAVRLSIQGQVIPWATRADKIIFSFRTGDGCRIGVKAKDSIKFKTLPNFAGEPHGVVLDDAVDLASGDMHDVGLDYGPERVMQRGALCRSVQMLGAMVRINELTLQYSHDRKQFKRSLSDFQIIQSYLAEMAGELAAASVLIDVAVARIDEMDAFEHVAAAKIRTAQASRQITSLGHQVHGAFGFTQEAPLNIWSRRVWAWRDDYGNEAEWAAKFGGLIITRGGDALWSSITGQMNANV